jgi:hypothetical protein
MADAGGRGERRGEDMVDVQVHSEIHCRMAQRMNLVRSHLQVRVPQGANTSYPVVAGCSCLKIPRPYPRCQEILETEDGAASGQRFLFEVERLVASIDDQI